MFKTAKVRAILTVMRAKVIAKPHQAAHDRSATCSSGACTSMSASLFLCRGASTERCLGTNPRQIWVAVSVAWHGMAWQGCEAGSEAAMDRIIGELEYRLHLVCCCQLLLCCNLLLLQHTPSLKPCRVWRWFKSHLVAMQAWALHACVFR